MFLCEIIVLDSSQKIIIFRHAKSISNFDQSSSLFTGFIYSPAQHLDILIKKKYVKSDLNDDKYICDPI